MKDVFTKQYYFITHTPHNGKNPLFKFLPKQPLKGVTQGSCYGNLWLDK